MMPPDFVAIDFETANEQRVSACAIGIAVVTAGKVSTRTFLIRPPELRFCSFNVDIHGITPKQVIDAPTFPDLLPEIRDLLDAPALWAHNSPFDQGVLNALASQYGLSLPKNLRCTCRLARRVFPQLPSHKLDVVCRHLSIPLKHHDAGSDAEACARIVLLANGIGPKAY